MALDRVEVEGFLPIVPKWQVDEKYQKISRTLAFENWKAVMAAVNQISDLAETENHHPDLQVSYSKLKIELQTHALGGLSENDFILAAKIDELAAR